jgi:hypothetical protein
MTKPRLLIFIVSTTSAMESAARAAQCQTVSDNEYLASGNL